MQKLVTIKFKNGTIHDFLCENYSFGVALVTLHKRDYEFSFFLRDIESFKFENVRKRAYYNEDYD